MEGGRVAKFSLATTESYEVKIGDTRSEAELSTLAVAWDSNKTERFIMLNKPDGATTDKTETNAKVAFMRMSAVCHENSTQNF